MPRAADHAGDIRPLLSAGNRVLVDGHPICGVCGKTVWPIGPDRWRHVAQGSRFPRRSKWLARITVAGLRKLRTYDGFAARFPWAVRPDLGGPFVTSVDQWEEGLRRLESYQAGLRAVSRKRELRSGENPYLDLVRILAAPPPHRCADRLDAARVITRPAEWGLPHGLSQMLDLPERRRELAAVFSWAIPTEEALDVLARYAPLVEGGAGTGYWAALLQARGVEAVAYDLSPPGMLAPNAYHARGQKPWTRLHQGSSVTAVRRHRDRTLVLCWPPYEDDAASYAPLRAHRGEVAIYIGEGDDGATGSVRFHRELDLNWTLVEQIDLLHWPRLRDRLMVYRRNPARRAHRDRDRCDECKRFVRTGSIGRCDQCFERRPPALALRRGRHRVEYARETLETLPAALRKALEESPNRIR
jgi:hypothetical protein